jgi:hypothetical protein
MSLIGAVVSLLRGGQFYYDAPDVTPPALAAIGPGAAKPRLA